MSWLLPQNDGSGGNDQMSGMQQPRPLDSGEGMNDDRPAWMHHAKRYEWNGEDGDVGPRHEGLEKQLFETGPKITCGEQYNLLTSIKVKTEGTQRPAPIASFDDAGLHPVIRENCRLSGYDVPTPIQAYTIPAVAQGRDIVGIAQTGSGKTAAYLVPTLNKLAGKAKQWGGKKAMHAAPGYDHRTMKVRAEPLMLIVVPTRELCLQIFDEARRFCYRTMLRPCVIYGGAPVRGQRQELEKGCDILIATPGRLRDFMKDPELLSMKLLRFTVVDEADEMLHSDWEEEMNAIFSGGDMAADDQHQYLLFSATFNGAMRRAAKKYLAADFLRIRTGRTGSTVATIRQQIIWVDSERKKEALYDLIMAQPVVRTLVFCNSKKSVEYVDDHLFNLGVPTTSIHSDRLQTERESSIRAFANGKAPILIATGVAARGLDIPDIMHVINFDLPSIEYGGADEYIHRIGRTGRLGNEGVATSFYNDRDEPLAGFLAKILTENGWQVPDFLEEYKPTGEIDFEDDSDGEEENAPLSISNAAHDSADDDAWGNGGAATPVAQEAWGPVATGTSTGTGTGPSDGW